MVDCFCQSVHLFFLFNLAFEKRVEPNLGGQMWANWCLLPGSIFRAARRNQELDLIRTAQRLGQSLPQKSCNLNKNDRQQVAST